MKQTGVFTQMRGKLGAMIYQVINGQQIGKTFAIPNNPDSPAQQGQRGVFGEIVTGFKSIASGFLDIFWNPFTTGYQTGWGNFISKNLLSMGKTAFDITKAILSYGSLERILSLSATYDTATGAIVVTFSDDEFTNGQASDDISVVAFDTDSGVVVGKFLAEDTRDGGTISVSIAAGFTATEIEIFAICSQADFITTGIGLVSTSDNCTCTAAP